MFIVRTRLPYGYRKLPSSHAEVRVATVLSGILHIGFGNDFNEQCTVPVAKGETWTIPAHRSYYLWAKEGDVLVQVLGNDWIGASGTRS